MESPQKNIFWVMDKALFEMTNKLKNSPEYAKFSEYLVNFDQEVLKVINKLVVLFLISFPILVIISLFSWNSSIKNSISIKENILAMAVSLQEVRQELEQFSGRFQSSVQNANQFNEQMRQAFTTLQLDLKKFSTDQFQTVSEESSFGIYQGNLVFKGLGLKELHDISRHLTQVQGFKVKALTIKRQAQDASLDGEMTLAFMARLNGNQ